MDLSKHQTLLARIQSGPIFQRWHWLQDNFTPGSDGMSYFAPLIVRALVAVDDAMPGYAEDMVARLEQVGGRDRNIDDYETIIQWLAEVLISLHLVELSWPGNVRMEKEPKAGDSLKNPELLIDLDAVGKLGVEVKAPSLSRHRELRQLQPWQLLARTNVTPNLLDGSVTLPRDNPVKDFLQSADAKFAGFRDDPNLNSILFIVWDDFVNEPISALLSPSSGLFTSNSFDLDESNNPRQYPNLDGVVLLRHQHQFIEGMANRPPLDARDTFLDYGGPGDFPPHVLIPNPFGRELDPVWIEALGAWHPESLQDAGSEYLPAEIVAWI